MIIKCHKRFVAIFVSQEDSLRVMHIFLHSHYDAMPRDFFTKWIEYPVFHHYVMLTSVVDTLC